ncbi:hypothetical protein AB0D04_42490 [Streptomyces sp. NPDC048483]|uniref:hypothetical protein n=1 Tax=Streptomyces sp. NPDC048483 TaxID=3154927 RepID=UPI0034270361
MPTLDSVGICPVCVVDAARLDAPPDRTVMTSETVRAHYPNHLVEAVWYVMGQIDMAAGFLHGAVELPGLPPGGAERLAPLLVGMIGKALLLLADVDPLYLTRQERALLRDALTARNAAIEGDTETVDAFARTWLGLDRPERWREAVEMALLGDWAESLGQGAATDPYVRGLLLRQVRARHRDLRPLWERRVRGGRSVLLSRPVGTTLTVADLLAEHRAPESEALAAELEEGRLASVLRALHPAEAAVARAWAMNGESWDRAAAAAGQPEAFGERVRRKLKRLGARHATRSEAAAAWKAGDTCH